MSCRASWQNCKVIRAYGVEDADNQIAWPAVFVVDRTGQVLWRSLSETYKVRPAAERILEALTSRSGGD